MSSVSNSLAATCKMQSEYANADATDPCVGTCIQMDMFFNTCTLMLTHIHFGYCLYDVWSLQIDYHSQLIHLIRKREGGRERAGERGEERERVTKSINHRLNDMSLVLKFS